MGKFSRQINNVPFDDTWAEELRVIITKSSFSELKYQLVDDIGWEEASRFLANLTNEDDFWIFRGHSNDSWQLSTSIERSGVLPENRLKFERRLIDQFKRRIHFYLTQEGYPTNTVEWLALMQHYGAYTRLMDWTKSPYVAAFFAMVDCKNNQACVWALNLTKIVQGVLEKFPKLFKGGYQDDLKKTTNASGMPEITIDVEDERILEAIDKFGFEMVFPAYPYKLNERISGQQGIFLTPGSVERKFEDCIANVDYDDSGLLLKKVILKNTDRTKALGDLGLMNINYRTLFPGVEGVIKSLNEENLNDFV